MRRVDELARFCNDARARLPQTAWSWPLIAAAAGALFMLASSYASERPPANAAKTTTSSTANAPAAPAAMRPGCENQTWPYLSDDCLRRPKATNPAAGGGQKHVRVLQYEPAMAAAAIGATQWAPKHEPSSRRASSRNKQATHERERTVTVRSGRRGRVQERTFAVPADAFSAYGSARRR